MLSTIVLSAQEKPDAARIYRNARDLEAIGRTADSKAAYRQAADICRSELAVNPKNIESYVVLSWALFRLGEYVESIAVSNEALKLNPREWRIIENLGECYFYRGNFTESLKMFERYIDGLPNGERISTVYFFIGEVFRIQERYNHADIAYTTAVYKEPGIALWWYRLGSAREAVGDKENAKSAYQRALRLNSNYKEASDGLSRVNS